MKLARKELDVAIATRDAPSELAFYRDLLGMEALAPHAMRELGTQSRLRIGGHTLKICDFARAPEPCEGGTNKANGIRLLAFILDDLDSVLARFDAAGHRYRNLGRPDDSPFQVAFSQDPDGNALELVGLSKPLGEAFTTRMQIGLTVPDIQRSRHFYGELLGLRAEPEMKLPRNMGVVANTRYGFLAGRTTIKFWSCGDGLPTLSGAPARRTGIRLMTAWVDDVDAMHEQLAARGVEIALEPHDLAGLARVMFIVDPDDNWIEFASPL